MAWLKEGDLARMMLEEQQKPNWPGLALEVANLCANLGLEDAATTRKDRTEYQKEVVKDKIDIENDVERMRDKKIRIMIQDDRVLKEYVNKGNIYNISKAW